MTTTTTFGMTWAGGIEYERDELRRRVRQLEKKPGAYATVLEVTKDDVELILSASQRIVSDRPVGFDVEPGDLVRLAEGGQILRKVPREQAIGAIATVRVVTGLLLEIEAGMESRMVRSAVDAKAGDRVLLDVTNSVAIRNLGPAPTPLVFTGEIAVEWDDVGGHEEAKRALREAIEDPFTKKGLYARYGRRPTGGILLFGPPGTGKTLLAKAAASANAKIHGASARATGFIYVRGPELLNKFIGNTEENVRKIFQTARLHREREGYPALVFVDEADAVLSKRGRGAFEGMEKTIVPQFLAEMDGLDARGAIVMLATNRADVLDPAIVRDGRVDRKIHVKRPAEVDAVAIFERALAKRPVEGTSAAKLAKLAAAEMYRDVHALAMIRCKDAKDSRRFALRDIASGALIVGIVEQATQLAIRREVDTEREGGITKVDMMDAIGRALEENRAIDHTEALAEVLEPMKDKIVGVDRVRSYGGGGRGRSG